MISHAVVAAKRARPRPKASADASEPSGMAAKSSSVAASKNRMARRWSPPATSVIPSGVTARQGAQGVEAGGAAAWARQGE
jgi:hypothetical protein